MGHVMDDSGGSDPGVARGVVAMPDAESLRRSVAAASGMDQGRPGHAPAGNVQPALEATAAPVSATSSGTANFAMSASLFKTEAMADSKAQSHVIIRVVLCVQIILQLYTT